ncbi:MAG TPA: hypothetical protein VHC67_09365 [Gaiellaceae bacterium]|jgi:hypothetical protein|nr:hypothetical protein [Gaiellaceae bacterium]
MKKGHRALVGACAALATLAFAGTALATYAPKLVVSSTGGAGLGGPTRIGVVVGTSDDPTARTTIYVPTGYTVATPSPGTDLGKVTATASAADLGGAVLPLTGELDAIAPNPTTQAQAQACGVTPTQTWDLHLSAAGQTLDIPLFVVAPLAPETALGFVDKLVVCLPPPDVPVNTPGRAVFGAKLLSATFTSSAITQPTNPGDYRWTSLFTPYVPTKGQPNAAGSVEVQSLRHLPAKVTLGVTRRRVVTHRTVKVRGKKVKKAVVSTAVSFRTAVTENGQPAGSATVTVTARGKKVGTTKGSFTMTGVKSATLTATAAIDAGSSVPTGTPTSPADLFFHDLGPSGCVPTPLFQGLPCTDATQGGETARVSVVVRAYTK